VEKNKKRFCAKLIKDKYSQGLIDLGNLSVASLIFGQAFGGFKFDPKMLLLGMFLVVLFYSFAMIVIKGGKYD